MRTVLLPNLNSTAICLCRVSLVMMASAACAACAALESSKVAASRMPAQTLLDLAEPRVELFGAAAIHRRERTDHAVAACGHHEIDAGDEEHRRRDQRQAEALAKACQRVGGFLV